MSASQTGRAAGQLPAILVTLNPARLKASNEVRWKVETLLNEYLRAYKRKPYGLLRLFEIINKALYQGAWGRALTPQARDELTATAWRSVASLPSGRPGHPPLPPILLQWAKTLIHEQRFSLKQAANQLQKDTGHSITVRTLRRYVPVRKPL